MVGRLSSSPHPYAPGVGFAANRSGRGTPGPLAACCLPSDVDLVFAAGFSGIMTLVIYQANLAPLLPA